MGLREIIIEQPDEFGLKKQIRIRNIFVDIERQIITVSYQYEWYADGEMFKVEKTHYELTGDYLTLWDNYTGDIIESGIRSWFKIEEPEIIETPISDPNTPPE